MSDVADTVRIVGISGSLRKASFNTLLLKLLKEKAAPETALKAFTHLAQFRFEAGFRTWLIQIGLNEIRQWRRKYASSPLVESTYPVFAEAPIADQSHSPFSKYQRVEAGA